MGHQPAAAVAGIAGEAVDGQYSSVHPNILTRTELNH